MATKLKYKSVYCVNHNEEVEPHNLLTVVYIITINGQVELAVLIKLNKPNIVLFKLGSNSIYTCSGLTCSSSAHILTFPIVISLAWLEM